MQAAPSMARHPFVCSLNSNVQNFACRSGTFPNIEPTHTCTSSTPHCHHLSVCDQCPCQPTYSREDSQIFHYLTRAGRSMSVILQDPDSRSGERISASSSTHTTSSSRSPQTWFHRTSNRSVPNLADERHSNRLRSIVSIKELVRKTSRQVLNPIANRQSLSNNQQDLSQRHASVTQLPGSPGALRCRPQTLIIQDSTHSSLESLTPDQSGISNDSSGPKTPASAHAVLPSSVYIKNSLDRDMGNTESKVGKVTRKPIPGSLRGKKSLQTLDPERSHSPEQSQKGTKEDVEANDNGQASETGQANQNGHTEISKTKENGQVRQHIQANENGPPPVLRHRASSGQIQVPRRRSSLTALHLDSSHFERPASSKQLGVGYRTSSFSDSFVPIGELSSDTTCVLGFQRLEDVSQRLLSPGISNSGSRLSSAGESTPSPTAPLPTPSATAPVHTQIRFPHIQNFSTRIEMPTPPLMLQHHQCYVNHYQMKRQTSSVHPVPCMTCSLNHEPIRYKCWWCDLRICMGCMRQLHATGRSLKKLLAVLGADEQTQTEKGKNRESIGSEVVEDAQKKTREA